MLKEAFSQIEVKWVITHTALSNYPSQKILQKNEFIQQGSKIDSDDDGRNTKVRSKEFIPSTSSKTQIN